MLPCPCVAGEELSAAPALTGLLQSAVPGITWPSLAAGEAAYLGTLMFQLEQTQWLPADAIAIRQHQQLVETATHAGAYSSYFRSRLEAAGLRPEQLSTLEGLRRLPVMRRRDVQAAGETLFCTQIPRAHAPVTESSTSGSSGEPVVVKRTAVSRLMWLAMTLREHMWQRRDFGGRLAVIRANLQGGKADWPSWGPPAGLLFETGPSHGLVITTDVAHQAKWLHSLDPEYLLVYPSNLAALLGEIEQHGLCLPRLRQIRTIGETLHSGTREAAQRVLGVDITDTYSSEEAGIIAVQCPESGLYHVMAESLIVEVLDERGEACMPGQIGRVVITDLHNFATPLIRYELGDFAETSDACPCGRGLPVLKRIVGRSRNMVRLPDGRSFWPLVGFARYRDVAPIRQYQLIQRELETLEVRLVSDTSLTPDQERKIGDLISKAMGYCFKLRFVYFEDQIPGGPGGKFEEFICDLAE
jgi:phenylacetate-coenzyme A ligase PaaK-like adenylate-forming protein